MDVLTELRSHEADHLDRWYDLSAAESERLYKGIAHLAEKSPQTIRQYCQAVIPEEHSSLTIVYEALSEHSTACDEILYDEVKRLTKLAREGRFDCEHLTVLSDIDTLEMYDNNRRHYVAIIDCLVGHLDPPGTRNFTIAVLELLEWFFLDYDEDDKLPELEIWTGKVERLSKASDPEVRQAAEDALDSLKGLSFLQKAGCLISVAIAAWPFLKLLYNFLTS